jgi:prepilin-type N-terminal cleavage/methylation domain-containing protein
MKSQRTGFTLVEVMITIAVLAIVAAMAIPSFGPDVATNLTSTADVVTADLMNIRQLAVNNNSYYRVTFETSKNRYYFQHTGSNAALNTLPTPLVRHSLNTTTRQYIDIDELPHLNQAPQLYRVLAMTSSPTTTTSIEFGPYGSTTQSADTAVWLVAGTGDIQRYISITVNAVTGLVQSNDIDGTGPTASGS